MRFLAAGDLHYDDIPDGERRLELLTEEIGRQKPDFVVFLGDLCSPKEENRHLTDRLRGMGVPIHFVLGNHDLREGRGQALRFFGKEKGYEAFLCGSIRCILLDTNRSPEENGEQMEWLRSVLQEGEEPVCVFSHHSLVNEFARRGAADRVRIRSLLQARSTLLCMNGHDHGNDCRKIGRTVFFTVNAMSYVWQNLKPANVFPEEEYQKRPGLRNLLLYRDPLWATVELTPHSVHIAGQKSEWLRETPQEIGMGDRWNGVKLAAEIPNAAFDWKEETKGRTASF